MQQEAAAMTESYPILEHDPSEKSLIEPGDVIQPQDVPEHCVITFFKEVIEKTVQEQDAKIAAENHWEDGRHPIYEMQVGGKRVAFVHPGVGGPVASGILEEAIAFGCRKFIVCGGCGVLEKEIAVGHLIVVSAALRDEGVSYHYLPPGREIEANPLGRAALETVLQRRSLPYVAGKTWTTDAPYRETRSKIAARRAEGCIVVEMEAASLMAVARFRGVPLGQILYGGDDVSGDEWDNRKWQTRAEVRESLFWLAVEAVLEMEG
jgi:uridine phosphorylase